ncbi:hypothetical protein [Nocardia aurantia]|uniref:Uncharacterized protein n=1 Tax=Nocardia aurantia TaxID=2585199 RepID=A0A7K0DI58_9NOCA|nr:hypothetical protein [Nocardia aurantia]MQY25490.1 hypothetical protein [Nocardia aurantia]
MKLVVVAAAAAALLVSGCGADVSGPGLPAPVPPAAATGSAVRPVGVSLDGATGRLVRQNAKTYLVTIDVHGSGDVVNMTWKIASENHLGGAKVNPKTPFHVARPVTADSPFEVSVFGYTDPGADLHCTVRVDGRVVLDQASTVRGLYCDTFVQVE